MRVSEGRVIVTGASRGIGRGIAEAILAKGGRVVAIARDGRALDQLCAVHPDRVVPLTTDLSALDQCQSIVDRAADAFGGIDGLVNNAGVLHYEEVGGITANAVQTTFAVNLAAPVLLMQAVAEHLRARGGAIVNVSSSAATQAVPGLCVYSGTKAALNAATRTFARALAPDGIRVNAVLPALISTDMTQVPPLSPGEGPLSEEEARARVAAHHEALRKRHRIGRLGTPEDVAEVVIGLLDHPWQTGSLVLLDGGLTLD